jgi:hypothetical protein
MLPGRADLGMRTDIRLPATHQPRFTVVQQATWCSPQRLECAFEHAGTGIPTVHDIVMPASRVPVFHFSTQLKASFYLRLSLSFYACPKSS